MDASFKSFLGAFTIKWFEGMSGGLGVPLMIVGILAPKSPLAIGLGLTGAAAFVFAAYRVWQRERLAVIANKNSSRLIGVHVVSRGDTYNASLNDELIVVDKADDISPTIHLPKDVSTGHRLEIKRGGNKGNINVTVHGSGKEIDGGPQYILAFPGQAIIVTYTGSAWVVT